MEMEVFVLTHGKHTEGDKEYDGPLSKEGIEAVGKLRSAVLALGEIAAFCGEQRRHRATRVVAGVVEVGTQREAGNDKDMFDALAGSQEPIGRIHDWICKLAKEGKARVLVIGSRFFCFVLAYLMRGGEQKFGPFGHFAAALDEVPEAGDVPLRRQAVLWSFRLQINGGKITGGKGEIVSPKG